METWKAAARTRHEYGVFVVTVNSVLRVRCAKGLHTDSLIGLLVCDVTNHACRPLSISLSLSAEKNVVCDLLKENYFANSITHKSILYSYIFIIQYCNN